MAAVAIPRRFISLLWLFVLVFVAVFFFSSREDPWSVPRPPKSWHIPFTTDDGVLTWKGFGNKHRGPVKITILESVGTHDEVLAALVHSFGGHESVEMNIFLKRQRYNMSDIINNFTLSADIVSVNKSKAFQDFSMENPPHILISTTCEYDLAWKNATMSYLLANATTHTFCVVHHADKWAKGYHVDIAREWAEQGRLDFIALSEHTTDYLVNKSIAKWKSTPAPNVRVFPPVFPVSVPEADPLAGISLAMQGDYSSGRRDYKGVFDHLGGIIRNMNETFDEHENTTVSLHVIGHGDPPKVPQGVQDHVNFDTGLSYPDFYALLSRASFVIPAFASDHYLDRKASSTIPAALIAGAPLVANEDILKAYTYLPREAVWVAKAGEGEMDVVEQAIGDRDNYLKKRDLTRATTRRLIEENRQHVGEWIAEVLDKAGGD